MKRISYEHVCQQCGEVFRQAFLHREDLPLQLPMTAPSGWSLLAGMLFCPKHTVTVKADDSEYLVATPQLPEAMESALHP